MNFIGFRRSDLDAVFAAVSGRNQVQKIDTRTVVNQFKRSFDEATLNALGKRARLCRRERVVTPHRLALSMIEAFAKSDIDTIADIQRTFNACCAQSVQYKPFHNQLAKPQFPIFMRLLLTRLMNELAMEVLRFSPASPFARLVRLCHSSIACRMDLSSISVMGSDSGSDL